MNSVPYSPPNGVKTPACLLRFQSEPGIRALPVRFTFPFLYEPHPLGLQAAADLQAYLNEQAEWKQQLGVDNNAGAGKMFGVLVVQCADQSIAYLAAFSGKLAGSNHHPHFVPPVFDILPENGFYRQAENELNALNREIENLEMHPDYHIAQEAWLQAQKEAQHAITQEKSRVKQAKAMRHHARERLRHLPEPEKKEQEALLEKQSIRDHFLLKDLKKHWKTRLEMLESQFQAFDRRIQALRSLRAQRSADVQQRIFDHYTFLNQYGTPKSLNAIFKDFPPGIPPAGAGECAAPKLLQYAFLHHLKPLALAEFWWGASPPGEIRKHGNFYPACRGKCLPILSHMLEGIETDPNPLLNPAQAMPSLEILYEDEFLVAVNKAPGLLSVPGKKAEPSVYSLLRTQYPELDEIWIVHRLDQATSGILLAAKDASSYKNLQAQFAERRVQKRYLALLDGIVAGSGRIDLPLRVDLNDRPRQMVCFEYGKPARTHWKALRSDNGRTRVHFFPLTGRTHQLRVHAAHPQGLNCPIAGDSIYGNPAERLFLHAEHILFQHPHSGIKMELLCRAPF